LTNFNIGRGGPPGRRASRPTWQVPDSQAAQSALGCQHSTSRTQGNFISAKMQLAGGLPQLSMLSLGLHKAGYWSGSSWEYLGTGGPSAKVSRVQALCLQSMVSTSCRNFQ